MKQSILEQEIERWATERGYPITTRIFYQEIQFGNEIARTLGADDESVEKHRWFSNLIRFVEGKNPILPGSKEEDDLRTNLADYSDADLIFNVLTPTGALKYQANFKESIQGMPNKEKYEAHLDRVKGLPRESISFVYSWKKLSNWRSDKISIPERFNKGNFYVLNLIEGSSTFRIDFLKGDGNVLQLVCKDEDKDSLAKYGIKVFEDLKEMYPNGIPRTSQGYRSILEGLSRMIESAA